MEFIIIKSAVFIRATKWHVSSESFTATTAATWCTTRRPTSFEFRKPATAVQCDGWSYRVSDAIECYDSCASNTSSTSVNVSGRQVGVTRVIGDDQELGRGPDVVVDRDGSGDDGVRHAKLWVR